MNSPEVLLEVCVDSVESAVAAQQGGAARVELCADLSVGGVTPSAGRSKTVREQLSINLHVMVRPRGGDFCYSDAEFKIIQRDIINAKQVGADGIVCGILKTNNTVDAERMRDVIALASPLSVTFHRAFDLTRDPVKALEEVIALGAHRLLTSGQGHTAMEGLDTLALLAQHAKGRIRIIAAGGINENNVSEIIAHTHVQELHVASAVTKLSVVDAVKVRNLIRLAEMNC